MINKIKKSAATFLTSLIAFSGLVSAIDSSKAEKSDVQTTVLPVQQQSLAPINITVINEESVAAKLLAATKIAFLGTGTVGVGACCYKVYKFIDNTDNSVQNFINVANTGMGSILNTCNNKLDNILEKFKQILSALPEEQALQLIGDIHNILFRCNNSIDIINDLLRGLDIENFNGIGRSTVEMIDSLKEAIREVLASDNNGGRSVISALMNLCSQKIQPSKK